MAEANGEPSAKRQKLDVKEIDVIGGSKVCIAPGILDEIPERILATGIKATEIVIVSDETVFGHYGAKLITAFERVGITSKSNPRLLHFAFKPGESSKTRETKAAVEDFMLTNRCTRSAMLVALGGGVVGDLVGFTAATYMRGIPVMQVPTSTMAIIDSSVGGKTAINVPAGKNMIGAFHQPRIVFADPHMLRTLSHREVVEGLAEAVKMGVIQDTKLFELMEKNAEKITALDPQLLKEVLHSAVAHKARIVAIDEKETGLRATLNYGHTIGHAIEGLVSPQLLHGECVSIGCVWEAELAARLGHIPKEAVGRIKTCLASYHLPVKCPSGLSLENLMGKMAVDKKNEGKTIRCTIITSIGTSIDHPVPVEREDMEAVLKDMLAEVA